MLQPIDRYNLVPYDQVSVRPWCGQEDSQMKEDDPRFMPLMENVYGGGVEAAKILLRSEIELSDVPYSNMHTACVIETERPNPARPYEYVGQMHTGHRSESLSEPNGFTVVTAVEMALSKITHENETICGVYLTGRDLPGGKIKRFMPLPTDYDHIVARFSQDWGPPFFVIPPESYDSPGLAGVKWVLQNKHVTAYAQHERIVISEQTEDANQLRVALQNYTHLKGKDIEFVADLTKESLEHDWNTFFTGSASGLGEITPALTDEYDDMDFMVTATDPEKAEAVITKLTEQHYGPVTKIPEVAYDTYGGKKIKGFFLFNTDGKKLVQLAIGKSMNEVCFRPDVMARNSGIWLHDSQ